MNDRDEYFGDVMYDVWRIGGDPDRVDRDRVEDHWRDGIWPEEAAREEMRHQQPEPVPAEFAFLSDSCPAEDPGSWEQLAREHDEYMRFLFWTENIEWPIRHPMEDVAGGD